ncbi:hypothetical protein EVAR_63142_1 [Eumeta japonica]|uniref:E3 ubiquitin-protein ligase Topors n=1 Tax=Eumeta variegata TaxID=151549 RepID=A0A4C2A9L9_EUMVA|nr:hypothetical protein EVAR_63142_1 [Eumeta japonica]
MEAVPAETSEESSVGNPRIVKSGNSSPRSNGGRNSPPNCAICLGACENSSFTDSCLHQFCFNCLLTWSKVKAECPLCKQNFRSIIHNVRSLNQYEEYLVEQRQTDAVQMINIDNISHAPPRFRYRTTLTLPRRDSMAIQQLLHYSLVTDFLQPSEAAVPRITPLSPASRYRPPASFRRTVYRHNLWARPLPDFTGRFRDCSPQFYRYNDAQMHRLVPWINRELNYLLNENPGHISYVLSKILELLPNFHINSVEFMNALRRYLGERTEHFLHELYCFASTPYDMAGYDRNVQYTTDPRVSTVINEVITSESESSDSDIVLVSSSELVEPPAAGPSRLAGPSASSNRPSDLRSGMVLDPQIQTDNNIIPIETISQSDSDDNNSEVMVIGYIKPPQERTPEVVDLLGSDSDVVVQDAVDEDVDEPPIVPGPLVPVTPLHPLVKVSLKQHRSSTALPDTDSESDEELFVPRARRRPRSVGSATTVNTYRTTPPGSPTVTTDPSWSPSFSCHLPNSASSFFNNTYSSLSEDSEPAPRKRTAQHKSKKKSKSRHRSDAVKAKTNSDKKQSSKRKLKSRSWKEVKSSKKRRNMKDSSDVATNISDPPNTDQPSTSGLSRRASRKIESRHKSKRDRSEQCRVTGESKRLKSVVSIPQNRDSSQVQSTVVKTNSCLTYYSDDSSSTTEQPLAIESTYERATPQNTPDAYDSEDDLPLNLTVNKH